MLESLMRKAIWFLKLYIIEYKYLIAFIAVFVLAYILFMHWLNIRILRKLRGPAAVCCMIIEIMAIVYFTILFRETGASHSYELELFWSYKRWILGGSIGLGMEILNNILLFFPLGFILTDAFERCPFWAMLITALGISCMVEISQLLFKIGLFEFDDILNNVMGAAIGWCTFHILRSFKRRRERV